MKSRHAWFSRLAIWGLAVSCCLGCQPKTEGTKEKRPAEKTPEKADQDSKDGGHSHAAFPTKTVVYDWAEGMKIRFNLEGEKKKLTLEVLDGTEEKNHPIKADKLTLKIPLQLEVELAASPLEGEAEGSSSRFVAEHDEFAKMHHVSGSISGTVDGKELSGQFRFDSH